LVWAVPLAAVLLTLGVLIRFVRRRRERAKSEPPPATRPQLDAA